MHGKRIIALYSPRPECGKSTLAEMAGATVISFAEPMRRMIAVLLVEAGYTQQQAWHYMKKEKNTPLSLIPGEPTARHLLRTLGTEWGRNHVNRELWTTLGVDKARKILALEAMTVNAAAWIDDLRFENEAIALQAAGALLVRIVRPQAPLLEGGHVSDGGLNHWRGPDDKGDHRHFDMEILNDSEDTEALKGYASQLQAIGLGLIAPPDLDGWSGPKAIRENVRTGETLGLYVRGGQIQWRDAAGVVVKTSPLFDPPGPMARSAELERLGGMAA